MKVVKCDVCGKEMKIGVKVAIEAQVVEFKDIFCQLPKIKKHRSPRHMLRMFR